MSQEDQLRSRDSFAYLEGGKPCIIFQCGRVSEVCVVRALLICLLILLGIDPCASGASPKPHPVPAVRSNSDVSITLERSGCYGACPSYAVTVSTKGIEFDGRGFVVASGKHRDSVDPDQVRAFAEKFVQAGFYSLRNNYAANAMDNPTYRLSIEIDGQKKSVRDYDGAYAGMPKIVTKLEDAVDKFARTDRWISGEEGLVSLLRAEEFDFTTDAAQKMLREAASNGQVGTVREFLAARVPLPATLSKEDRVKWGLYEGQGSEDAGLLRVASAHADVLQVLIAAGASKDDQEDKDLALIGAARADSFEGVKTLIVYGANPNADLSRVYVTDRILNMEFGHQNAGTALIGAAQSGDPEMVRFILQYHPNLEARDSSGHTALFAAAISSGRGETDRGRVECVDLLAKAGANVNTRDGGGDTPLHESFYDDVIQELINLGADVNAVNDEGQTPIFRNVSDTAISIFVDHGADLTIRDKRGMGVFEAARVYGGPLRVEALEKAIKSRKHP